MCAFQTVCLRFEPYVCMKKRFSLLNVPFIPLMIMLICLLCRRAPFETFKIYLSQSGTCLCSIVFICAYLLFLYQSVIQKKHWLPKQTSKPSLTSATTPITPSPCMVDRLKASRWSPSTVSQTPLLTGLVMRWWSFAMMRLLPKSSSPLRSVMLSTLGPSVLASGSRSQLRKRPLMA